MEGPPLRLAFATLRWGGHAARISPEKGPMANTVILGTARTPFGKMGGALAAQDATDLGGHVIEAALDLGEPQPGDEDLAIGDRE